ncbi:flagellin [Roseospira marina]|nr:flagellin [Roseospira marina]MBB4313562.1 flagellin-like hook-associated protein FlgL [Roseospira marina]MBB5086724.1 flagellin-like hook-associated protein FlgL [Roseospira marina]
MTTPISTRVGTFAQRSSMIQQMMRLQSRLYDSQLQVATGQRSQTYTGISTDSFRLVSVETEKTKVEYYQKSNAIAQVRLDTMATSVNSIQDVLHNVYNDLIDLGAGDQNQIIDEAEADTLSNIQKFAFSAMKDLASYLNAKADGRYVFSGGRTDQRAVDFPYTTLEEFQAAYDGSDITYPTSREANVPDAKIGQDQHGGLTYGPGANTITPATAASTEALVPGTVIELTDGDITTQRFTVTARDTGTGALTVTPAPSGLPGAASDATISAVSYYGGDSLTFEHRVSDERTLDLGLNAKDGAFEKAFRALGMLAQGGLNAAATTTPAASTGTLTFNNANGTVTAATPGSFSGLPIGSSITFTGTANNDGQRYTIVSNDGDTLTLDPPPVNEGAVAADAVTDNLGRIEEAMALLSDATNHTSAMPSEDPSDIEQVGSLIGFNQVTLDRAIDEAKTFASYLSIRQTEIESVDKLEAAANLNNDALALETAMASFARISEVSLLSYI